MWLKAHNRLFNLEKAKTIAVSINSDLNDKIVIGEYFVVLKGTSNPYVVLRDIENQFITGAPFLDISDHVVRPE